MPATINCCTCAAKLRIPENADTQTFQCPKCGSLIDAANAPLEPSADSIRAGRSHSAPRESPHWEDEPLPTRHAATPRSPQKDPTTAVLLEILPGLFLQTFGIGHIYAGNVGVGLAFMFGYWLLTGLNVGLMFCIVGFASWPICWVIFLIVSPLLAAQACKSKTGIAHGRT